MHVRTHALWLILLTACHSSPAAEQPKSPTTKNSVGDNSVGATDCEASSLEAVARDALVRGGHSGAVVVLDLVHGEELAMADTRSRAGSAAPPASTVKPILALAGLRSGALQADVELPCGGAWSRDASYTCFHDHGALALTEALATSCNAYFYEVAARTGPEALAAEYRRVGLPTVADAVVKGGEHDIAVAIGHGDVTVTPRELAGAYASMIKSGDPLFSQVAPGMREAVASGTARAAAVSGLAVAGKTGTADTKTDGGEERHAWFVGYAPADEPRVVVLSYVVGGGTGGESAAPVGGAVLKAWFDSCSKEQVI